MGHTVKLTLPDNIYEYYSRRAKLADVPLATVLKLALLRGLPVAHKRISDLQSGVFETPEKSTLGGVCQTPESL